MKEIIDRIYNQIKDNQRLSHYSLFDPDAHTIEEYKKFEESFWWKLKLKKRFLKLLLRLKL